MKIISIYISFPDKKVAKDICNTLLKKKLIACVNYLNIESSYHWKGNIENEDEIVGLCKTQEKHWKDIIQFVESVHPYETPAIMKYDIEVNESYGNWVIDETNT